MAQSKQEYKKEVKTNNETLITPEWEQVIIFEVQDENGYMKEFITSDERKIIETKIKEYEKEKSITDRSGKMYVINNKQEVISVKELIK
ncbi:MAG: hypothetical protein A3F72_08105 [Bacteroidetes bacterium RIFCSPLOWO2_12_FULL_35_15]|nr:MAG: hypothetical protein A3F72_08105 [Bacteroidetes bacterium RIFCSPLOWO2_12_FULL_35_15]